MCVCGDLIESYIVLANTVREAASVEIFFELKKLFLDNSDVSDDIKNQIIELAKKFGVKI